MGRGVQRGKLRGVKRVVPLQMVREKKKGGMREKVKLKRIDSEEETLKEQEVRQSTWRSDSRPKRRASYLGNANVFMI